jgi:hypothetical protein
MTDSTTKRDALSQAEIRARLRASEHEIQCALVRWCDLQGPPYDLLYANPNGGHRRKSVAAKMKAEGVRAGVPDLTLPVPRGRFGALYLELKRPGKYPTAVQREMIGRLREAGNRVRVVRSVDEAMDAIHEYLNTED